MSNETLPVLASEFGIEEAKALTVYQSFTQKVTERDLLLLSYSELVNQEITESLAKQASDLRKRLVKARTGIADVHKVEKAFYLASGKYIDAVKNKLTLPIEQAEEKLVELENYFINLEKERIAKLKEERIAECTEYAEFIPFGVDLGIISHGDYIKLLNGAKMQFDAKVKAEIEAKELADKEEAQRIEKERIEKERIAKEQEAQRLENARLKAEAEAREKQIEAERKQQAEILAKQKAESDARLKAEADIKARLEAELKAKKDAEIKAENDRLEAEKQAKLQAEKDAKAPVKEQLKAWVKSFEAPQRPKSIEKETFSNSILLKFELFKNWANTEIDKI